MVNLFTEQKADNNHMDFFSWKAPGAGWQGEPLVRCRTTQPLRSSDYESFFYVTIYIVAVQPSAITWPCTPGLPKHLYIQPAAE